MTKKLDLAGKRFGRLIVLSLHPIRNKHKGTRWVCKCDCGEEITVDLSNLTTCTRSCGCIKQERTREMGSRNKGVARKHGLYHHRLYWIRDGMIQRCENPKNDNYKDYGGRGITICSDWRNSIEVFYNWAISNGYQDFLEIDREDNDGNYEPSNCHWVTRKQNCNNKRPYPKDRKRKV